MRVADLHLHTTCSDGSRTPAELTRAAHAAGLATIAVTDHDTMAGVVSALAAGPQWELEVIPGVELTCQVADRELHLLAYFFDDGWQAAEFQTALARAGRTREQRIVAIVEKLNARGMRLTVADVRAEAAAAGSLGRPHVAQALVKRGHVRSTEEAFDRFLRPGRPAYVDRERMSARDAISLVHRAGGVAVLAHPGLNRVDAGLRDLVAQGLDGVEVWHPKHTPVQVNQYRALAADLGLLTTGGSDDHGPGREALLGTVRLPEKHVTALRSRRMARC